MVATTRSQSKRAEKLGPSESKSGEFKKKIWRDWLKNLAVMQKAKEHWIQDIFEPKQLIEDPALIGRHRFTYVAKREWDSMPDNDKAPFIDKALHSLASLVGLKIMFKTAASERKQSKQARELELHTSQRHFFFEEYFEKHFMTHQDYSLTIEVADASERAWRLLPDSDKAAYVAKAKKEVADRDEVYKYLPNDDSYKKHFLRYVV